MRAAWLLILASVLLSINLGTPALADGTAIGEPVTNEDSVGTTCFSDTGSVPVSGDGSDDGTLAGLLWELWGLLF